MCGAFSHPYVASTYGRGPHRVWSMTCASSMAAMAGYLIYTIPSVSRRVQVEAGALFILFCDSSWPRELLCSLSSIHMLVMLGTWIIQIVSLQQNQYIVFVSPSSHRIRHMHIIVNLPYRVRSLLISHPTSTHISTPLLPFSVQWFLLCECVSYLHFSRSSSGKLPQSWYPYLVNQIPYRSNISLVRDFLLRHTPVNMRTHTICDFLLAFY
ncbi:hypothetical protein HYPSUDRAFT_38953 [Hypholoma sublateritium FD-334 SS-4]|uniref:Uncharacterized protein n=1 Tax=Hypholoma sublateritium (strain FD-334 SS-4) TaxID=945553 RepID=A0A0D2P6B6_HYPSF|nr:hypothetical protein HYPSUDRAFT_38953 [Hypholoma sublateritium FD-334 SS-4]